MASIQKFILAVGLLSLLGGCGTFSSPDRAIVVEQDSEIKVGNEPVVTKKTGERLDLPSDVPVLVESPGYMSVLLIPEHGSALTKVALKSGDKSFGDLAQRKIDRSLSELLAEVNEVQSLLSSKRAKEALDRVDNLQGRFPKVGYLNFLRASCLVVLNRKSEAKIALESAMKAFPDDKSGQKLMRSLASEGENTRD